MADNNLTNSFDNLFTNNLNVGDDNISHILSVQTAHLQEIERAIKNYSQGEAYSRRYGGADWRQVGRENRQKGQSDDGFRYGRRSNKSFSDGLEEALLDALGASNLKEELKSTLDTFAKDVGVDLEDIPHQFGKELGKQALGALSKTNIGKDLSSKFDSWKKDAVSSFKEAAINKYAERTERSPEKIRNIFSSNGDSKPSGVGSKLADMGMDKAQDAVLDKATGGIESLVAKGGSKLASGSLIGGAEAITSGLLAVPGLGEAMLALVAIEAITSLLPHLFNFIFGGIMQSADKVGKSFGKVMDSLSAAANRDQTSREKRIQHANERLTKDLESIIQSEFDVLIKASDRMIQAWEDNIKVINQTQGYSKAELQSLIGQYASRIRSEGLESVVSSADFTDNLGKVLESGLSGKVAEEFAYQATKLNAAVPTQDFFGYSNTYASIVGNAIKDGMSQSSAIEYANSQLETFASNVLYASRQLSGGLNVGLQNASKLFEQATQISVASRTGVPSNIAGVLTSVSAITGAIAPDLADAMVDAIYNAAVGGNDSQIVALRSLAGINASNTEFLRSFANDPQGVFSTLFRNLANMQNMSPDNYMEVADGLANVFGISRDSFARVDFNYLSQAIDNMSVSNEAITENMKHLASGESTLSAEQMRIRQINEYMIDEGLAYVLDNEAARAIQQHMWDEQLANQMQEQTYSVEVQGALAELANNIWGLLQNIYYILNPIAGIAHLVTNLAQTGMEMSQNNRKIHDILEAGKVGQGNSKVLKQLTTRGIDLKLTNSYLSMLVQSKAGSSSGYNWGGIGKSAYASIGTTATGRTGVQTRTVGDNQSVKAAINLNRMQQNFNRMQNSMSNYFSETINEKVESAIQTMSEKLARATIKDSDILKRANEYLENPEKYGIGATTYSSLLASSKIGANFDKDVAARSLEVAKQRAEADLVKERKESSLFEATTRVMDQLSKGAFGRSGYNAWVADANKFGISDYQNTLNELGYEESDVRNYFNERENQSSADSALQRSKDEEKFWSESQRYLNLINANIHDVFDKGDVMGILWPGLDAWLNDIDSGGVSKGSGFRADMYERLTTVNDSILSFKMSFEVFDRNWKDYYIKHTTYNKHLTGDENGTKLLATLNKVKGQKDKTTEDVMNALTEALMTNPVGDLLDPTVQQNLFLAGILQCVQTIVQQNNTQGKLKLPDAISALATGMTSVDTTAAGAPATGSSATGVLSTLASGASKVLSSAGL